MLKAIAALKFVQLAKNMTEFFASIAEKWYQLAFHSTTTCFLSDNPFGQEFELIQQQNVAEHIYFVYLAVNTTEGSTPCVIEVLLNKKFYRTQRIFFFQTFECRIRFFMSRINTSDVEAEHGQISASGRLNSFSSMIYLLLCRKRQKK
jgi:hypothetical protein